MKGGREGGGKYLERGCKPHLQVAPVLGNVGGQLLQHAEERLLEDGLRAKRDGGRRGGREGMPW